MKPRGALFAILVIFTCALASAETRTWTARTGKWKVEGEFIEVKEGKVRLRKPDGKVVSVAHSALSEEDQLYILGQGGATQKPATRPTRPGTKPSAKPSTKPKAPSKAKPTPENDESDDSDDSDDDEKSSEEDYKVEVVSLQIARPTGEKKEEDDEDDVRVVIIRGFRGDGDVEEGTRIGIKVSADDGQFVGVDEKASKITSITDDQDTDLTPKDDKSNRPSGPRAMFERMFRSGPITSRISADHKLCIVQLSTPAVPKRGSEKLQLEAKLAMKVGRDEKTEEFPDAELANGTKLESGPIALEIEDIESGEFGDEEGMTVTVVSSEPLDALKGLTFFDGAGNEIKSHIVGRTSAEFQDETHYEITYALATAVRTATIKLAYYAKIETTTIDVNEEIDVGL